MSPLGIFCWLKGRGVWMVQQHFQVSWKCRCWWFFSKTIRCVFLLKLAHVFNWILWKVPRGTHETYPAVTHSLPLLQTRIHGTIVAPYIYLGPKWLNFITAKLVGYHPTSFNFKWFITFYYQWFFIVFRKRLLESIPVCFKCFEWNTFEVSQTLNVWYICSTYTYHKSIAAKMIPNG